MAMTLTRGDDSRLDGAPSQDLPNYADMVQEYAIYLVSQDKDGALYGGDPANARQDAIRYVKQQEAQKQAEKQAAEASRRADAQRGIAERAAAREARMGVDPEALPYATSARDIQEANRPLPEAEAALEMEQALAADIIRGSREGKRNWEAEYDLQSLQERGERNPLAAPGQRDLDVRRRLMEQRGQFYEMPDGTRIPVGAAPTAASERNLREFDAWANEDQGSERQARYDPQAYGQYREGVRQGIQERALKDMQDFGTGPADSLARKDAGLPALTDAQRENRERRSRSEDRVAEAQREVDIARLARKAGVSREQARQMMDAGRSAVLQGRQGDAGEAGPAGPAGAPLTAAERRLEAQRLRDMANTRQDALRAQDKALRQDTLRNQRLLLAPGGKGVANAINELPEGWRQIAILDRITNGRRGGATPLDVEAQQISNTLPVFRNMVTGLMQDIDPREADDRQMQRQIMLAQMPPEQRTALSIQMGEPMGTGYSSSHVGARWNYWMNNFGARPPLWREQNFRMEMEGLGYQPAQIDAWIDRRRDFEGVAPPAAPGAANPGGLPPGMVPP